MECLVGITPAQRWEGRKRQRWAEGEAESQSTPLGFGERHGGAAVIRQPPRVVPLDGKGPPTYSCCHQSWGLGHPSKGMTLGGAAAQSRPLERRAAEGVRRPRFLRMGRQASWPEDLLDTSPCCSRRHLFFLRLFFFLKMSKQLDI